jgi:hypothetical protein
MVSLENISVSGMTWGKSLLWLAVREDHQVVTYDPSTGRSEQRLTYAHEVWDVCPDEHGLWMMTGGGKLGRQIVFWSLEEEKELKKFSCPDGAGAGLTLYDGKIWMAHRHNRKLYCLDAERGKVSWVIRTENETFSPSAHRNELWLIEADPGPLGHWSEVKQGKYFFSRFDPTRERIVERLQVSFVPYCMAFDGERFWYAEQDKTGFASTSKSDCT